jgi:hypothetical protein
MITAYLRLMNALCHLHQRVSQFLKREGARVGEVKAFGTVGIPLGESITRGTIE